MPGMDGFETAASIKRLDQTKDVPIIFLTGTDADAGYAFRGYATGAADYLTKPLTPGLRAEGHGLPGPPPQEPAAGTPLTPGTHPRGPDQHTAGGSAEAVGDNSSDVPDLRRQVAATAPDSQAAGTRAP